MMPNQYTILPTLALPSFRNHSGRFGYARASGFLTEVAKQRPLRGGRMNLAREHRRSREGYGLRRAQTRGSPETTFAAYQSARK